MEIFQVVFDGILTILKHPVTIGDYTFSFFGLMVVSIGAYLVGHILKAIFGDD